MRLMVLRDAEAAAVVVADRLADLVRAQPRAVLGLATGATMEPVHAALTRRVQAGALSLAGVTTFNLDEYVGLSPDHPGAYHQTMWRALIPGTDLRPEAMHLPRGDAPDPMAEARAYETRIRAAGGIDLQLLGLGRNGHVGFNEPGTRPDSRCRVTLLAETTRAANARHFPGGAVPRRAITLGIGTILEARACLLLATGPAKAAAVAAMIEGPVGPACPASYLRRHPRLTVVLDREAAAGLSAAAGAAPPRGPQ